MLLVDGPEVFDGDGGAAAINAKMNNRGKSATSQ